MSSGDNDIVLIHQCLAIHEDVIHSDFEDEYSLLSLEGSPFVSNDTAENGVYIEDDDLGVGLASLLGNRLNKHTHLYKNIFSNSLGQSGKI